MFDILFLVNVYRSLVESVLTFNIVSWYGNLSIKDRTRLAQIVNLAGKIVGLKQRQLSEIYHQSLKRKANQIHKGQTHPLTTEFKILPSGRRLKVPFARKDSYKKFFIPSAVF